MKISKTVLGLVITGVLLAGWQKGSKAEEVAPAAEAAAPAAEATTPAAVPVAEVTAPAAVPVAEVTAPAAVPAAEATAPASTPAHATETTPVPADATVTAPAVPAVTAPSAENKEVSSPVTLSVAEIYAKKAELNGKSVTVFGNVVKVNMGVMGKNWIHLQDGTGAQGTNDITITTADTAKPADKVSVTGIVATDKDFGAGYKYGIIIEDASVKIQ